LLLRVFEISRNNVNPVYVEKLIALPDLDVFEGAFVVCAHEADLSVTFHAI